MWLDLGGPAAVAELRPKKDGREVPGVKQPRVLCVACWLVLANVSALLAQPSGGGSSAGGWPKVAQESREVDRITIGGRSVRRYLGVEYGRVGDVVLRADVFVPERPERMPAVMLIHGGAWAVGTRWQMWLHAQPLVQAGWAAVSIDYRLAPQAVFPAQRDDCRLAWRWMAEQGDRFGWDPQRMAVYGYSAGAHLALLLALDPDPGQPPVPRPRAVVAGGAPCSFDWLPPDSRTLAYFLGGSRRQVPDRYRQASPLAYVSQDDPPVLLFHGRDDMLVPLASVQRFQQRMEEVGGVCRLEVYPGWGHLATFLAEAPRKEAVTFLRRYLEPQAGPAELP
ncbi:MAG: hypothetical protein KatS3mg110_3813 [Pirellulaceae bacterium]|nr:MAG: hypothetical protein KatS3mg110_3813 [Pirellulaceae bacterium]